MMIKQLCYLFGKLHADEVMIIKLRDEWEVSVTKADIVKANNDVLTIYRARGSICVINPDQVIMAHTRKQGEIL